MQLVHGRLRLAQEAVGGLQAPVEVRVEVQTNLRQDEALKNCEKGGWDVVLRKY